MEKRTIRILNPDATLNTTIDFIGKESAKDTSFVLEYGREFGAAFSRIYLESLEPDLAFCFSLALPEECLIAEGNSLFALVRRDRDSVDDYPTTTFIGWVTEHF